VQLLVGLGNPGNQYEQTRHNIGFRFADALARLQGLRFDAAPRFKGLVASWERPGGRVLLVKPQTLMNGSGESVGAIARFYQIATADIFVIYDDLDLPPGKLRFKSGGGHGGHNGLKSLNQHLPDDGYQRIKVGIGRPPHGGEVTPWVLGRAQEADRLLEERLFDSLLPEIPAILAGEAVKAANRIHLGMQPGK